MSVGSRIRELREDKELSRAELADKIGVTIGAVSNYENEVSSPKEPILFKIMEVLEYDANYLFQDSINIPTMKDSFSVLEHNLIKNTANLTLTVKTWLLQFSRKNTIILLNFVIPYRRQRNYPKNLITLLLSIFLPLMPVQTLSKHPKVFSMIWTL